MNVLFLFHTYTFYQLDIDTYQFDFKLHYLAYIVLCSGVTRILFRGGVKIFWKRGVFALREALCRGWRSHAFTRGVRGHAPPIKLFKMAQFGAF